VRTPGCTEKHRPCAWPSPMIGILAEDHDADILQRSQVERAEPCVALAGKMRLPAAFSATQERGAAPAMYGIGKFVVQRLEPALMEFHVAHAALPKRAANVARGPHLSTDGDIAWKHRLHPGAI
jgi:hypothetical protein